MASVYEKYVRQCLALARRYLGQTQPNPLVACIVLDENLKKIAQGIHKQTGEHHAEINAIENARQNFGNDFDFSECTFIVNLEPCAHQGRTPSCAKTLAHIKPKKVVFGCLDKNPATCGQGIEILQQAGIQCVGPVLEKESEYLNRDFFYKIQFKKAMTTAKLAICKLGYMGEKQQRKPISSSACLPSTMKLRARAGAIVTGANTVNVDNPRLDSRSPYRHNKTCVCVIDPHMQLNLKLKLFDVHANVVLVTQEQYVQPYKEKLKDFFDAQSVPKLISLPGLVREKEGQPRLFPSEKIDCPSLSKVNLDFKHLYEHFKTMDINHVLLEAGPSLIQSFSDQGCIDEYCVYQSKSVEMNQQMALPKLEIKALQQAPDFVINKAQDDILIFQV